jgi:hypothetical protein
MNIYREPLPLKLGSYNFLFVNKPPLSKIFSDFFRYFGTLNFNKFHTEELRGGGL